MAAKRYKMLSSHKQYISCTPNKQDLWASLYTHGCRTFYRCEGTRRCATLAGSPPPEEGPSGRAAFASGRYSSAPEDSGEESGGPASESESTGKGEGEGEKSESESPLQGSGGTGRPRRDRKSNKEGGARGAGACGSPGRRVGGRGRQLGPGEGPPGAAVTAAGLERLLQVEYQSERAAVELAPAASPKVSPIGLLKKRYKTVSLVLSHVCEMATLYRLAAVPWCISRSEANSTLWISGSEMTEETAVAYIIDCCASAEGARVADDGFQQSVLLSWVGSLGAL
eukprot:680524-Prorocentrum_minimum.AAC.6